MGATEIVTAAVEPVNRLIECVSGAIGKAYEPRHIRKMADAKAYEMRVLSEEIRNNSDLPIVFNGNTAIDVSNVEDLIKRAGYRLAYQELAKQENIESIVDQAYDELDGKVLLSDENVSRDWMNRFIDSAGDISSGDMQSLWAKVLAGEVIEPNSFSLQTLDCLRNLSSKDAALFSKVCPFVISEVRLIHDDGILNKYGITYSDILYMDDCGLINSSGLISLTTNVSSDMHPIFDFGDYAVFVKSKDESETKIQISQFPLTRAGRELYSVAKTVAPPTSYIKEIVEMVRKRYSNCIFEIHKVIERSREGFRIQDVKIELDDLE